MNEWNKLSMADRAAYIKLGIDNGITDLATIRDTYNQYAEGGPTNPYSSGSLVDAIYKNFKGEEYLGKPSHNYDFTISEEEANRLGYYPDERGHRDDRVKKPTHPTHPSRGKWNSFEEFELTDRGMENPNYTLFGLNDGGQDPQAVMTYRGGVVLPEITVTPKKNYIHNPYDNINIYAGGGYVREKNDNPIAFDEEGNLVDQVTGEKGTMMLPEFTVRGVSPETKAKNYSSAYHPEDALEFLDIMTRPLTRPFSVSQQIGAIRNKINGGTYLGSLLGDEENLGIVSKQFNQQHPYLSMGANMLADVSIPLDIQGIKIANQLRPTNLRKHLYVNRIPFTYEGLPQLAKDMAKSILSGDTPDINAYPSWYNESVIQQLSELYKPYGLSGEDVIKARDDAFRLYLKFPQRSGTFTPYINDIYPKQTNRIFTDKNGVSKLKEIPKQIIGNPQLDFVNSVGGGIGVPRIDIIDTFGDKTYGITRTSDVWDLHPFSREKDRFIGKVIRPTYNKIIKPIIEVPYNKLRKLSQNISYDNQAIKDYIAKHPEEMEFGFFEPDMFPSKHYKLGQTIKRVNDKVLEPLLYPEFEKIKWLKRLDDKIANFEIGRLVGAEPFEVRYDIPWTRNLELNPKGRFYKKYIKGWDQSDNLPTEAYRFKKDNPNLDYKINK